MNEPFFATRKPRRCPACGSLLIVDIVYGFPTKETFEAAEAGEVVLGGCCMLIEAPSWQCRECKASIRRRTRQERT